MKKLLFPMLFILVFSNSNAQHIKKFSLDTTNYITELTSLFGNLLSEEEELVFNEFLSSWKTIDYSYREDIMTISELMRQRSCKARPHYIVFVKILEQFHGDDKLNYGYDDWVKSLLIFLDNKNSALRDINNIYQTTFSPAQ